MEERTRCEEDEFNCGNGQCIPGLGVCDGRYQCMNGADESMWWVEIRAKLKSTYCCCYILWLVTCKWPCLRVQTAFSLYIFIKL